MLLETRGGNSLCTWINDTSVVARNGLSNCFSFIRGHIPSLKKDVICGTGLTISAGFAIGGYFLIEHALDMTDHNYWHSYLHCPKTHSGTSHCELAIASMTWGAIFEAIALAGFTATGCIWFGPHNDVD